jgi:exodeoxyribonuclease V alpha subunit
MITRNLHDLGLFNGDTGILWSIDGELRACFRHSHATNEEGAIRDLALNRLSDIRPAWAITVHKSQGSEFDSVLLLLPSELPTDLLSRELLYTGITRARRDFPLTTLSQAIARLTRRHSGLADRLGWPVGAAGEQS